MPYEVIDHTADTGIRAWAPSPGELFTEAARAMFELITNTAHVYSTETRGLEIEGLDWTDLMINWLRELLFLWSANQYLVRSTRILHITETGLSARLFLQHFDPNLHVICTDIKAVTYHAARAAPVENGWEATVIFDI